MIANELIFFIYNIIYILIPGIIFSKEIKLVLKDNSFCNKILISYFIGFAILIFEFWVCSLLGTFWLFTGFTPVLIISYLVCRRKKVFTEIKQFWSCIDVYKSISFLCVIIACYILSFVYTTLKYGGSLDRPYVYLGQDYLNHIGLVASLSKGFPAIDLKVSGTSLHYHYFQDLFFAMCENIFNISAFELVTECTPVMVGCVFGTAIFCLLKRKTIDTRYRLRDGVLSCIRCGFFFVFGGAWIYPLTGITSDSGALNWNNESILMSENACGFAIAALIALLILAQNIDMNKLSFSNLATLFMLVFVATGAKGPFAVVFIASFLGVYILKVIIERKANLFILSHVIAGGIAFLISYFFIIRGIAPIGSSKTTEVAIQLEGTLNRTLISSIYSEIWNYAPFVGYCGKVALILLVAFGPLLLYFGACLVDLLKDTIESKCIENVFFCIEVGIIIIGAIAFIVVNQSGYSQVYFVFVAIVPLVHLTINYVERKSGVNYVKNVLFLALVAIFGFHLFASDMAVRLRSGFTSQNMFGYEEIYSPSMANVSHEEVNGLRWLYENTASDAVVLTDRRNTNENDSYLDNCHFFAYSAISERQMYIEGFCYSQVTENEVKNKIENTKLIYSSGGEQLDKLLEENSIDYIIVSKRFGTEFSPGSSNVKRCFENDDMMIYQSNQNN